MKTTQPRKQRKLLFNAPAHIRYKMFSAPFSPSLKASHNVSSLPVRMGDTVRVMRGDRKGLEGKVTKVDRKKYRINVEGITREKVDGTAIQIPIHPSKVMITNLNLDDKWRRESLKMVAAPAGEVKETKKPEKKKARRRKKPAEPKEVKEPVKEEKKRRPRKKTPKKTEKESEEKQTEESESG
jgi:large subunit ribosomal protein L24